MPPSNKQTSGPSSPNGSTDFKHECRALSGLVAEEIDQYGNTLKVQQANFLRMMQDNQRVLNTSIAEDRALRQQRHRLRDRLAGVDGQPIEFPTMAEEMGDINIDSPTETHNHYPAQSPAKSPLLPWILTAALAAGTAGYGLSTFLKPGAPGTSTTVNTKSGFLIELVEPEKGKP